MYRTFCRASVVGAMVLAMIPTIRASEVVTVSFQQGENNYSSTVDTFLNSLDPCSSHGSLEWVEIDGTPEKHGLLLFGELFGAGPNQLPLGSTIVSATLGNLCWKLQRSGNDA